MVVIALIAVSVPAVGRSVVDFARNAHKVDGFHAVGAGAGKAKRAGKLVATNRNGRLPNNIIAHAPDADNLGGISASSYLTNCDSGVVAGAGRIPADIGSTYSFVVGGYQYIRGAVGRCEIDEFSARRTNVGIYQVRFAGGLRCSAGGSVPAIYATVVTVKSERALFGASQTVCDEEGSVVEEVRIFDHNGTLQDEDFTIALMIHTPSSP